MMTTTKATTDQITAIAECQDEKCGDYKEASGNEDTLALQREMAQHVAQHPQHNVLFTRCVSYYINAGNEEWPG